MRPLLPDAVASRSGRDLFNHLVSRGRVTAMLVQEEASVFLAQIGALLASTAMLPSSIAMLLSLVIGT